MSDYTRLERLMHRMALGFPAITEISFAVDQALARASGDATTTGRHVFVAGLARAGTTILTRSLYESGAFTSLTYRDMPFTLAPGLWRLMRGGRNRSLTVKERAHGDGLMVDIDSPESLEEPFWRTFNGGTYIRDDRLEPHEPNGDIVKRYKAYLAAILKSSGSTRYLAKNNNNILRLGMLARTFPNAEILVPFRNPLTHSASLLNQHHWFCTLHQKDKFAGDYMGWLAHHEFGGDHRPFATHPPVKSDPMDRAYWLAQWHGVYAWLFSNAPENVRFVCYEDLCNDPRVWKGLSATLGIPAEGEPFRAAQPFDHSQVSQPEVEALALYDRLADRARKNLRSLAA